MKHAASITSLPPAPEADRRARMIKYSVTMGIRLACVFACFFVHGWWLLIPAIGAVVLPYIAVVIANVHSNAEPAEVMRPGAILPVQPRDDNTQ
ncbi:MAG: DUF3099 domain-containing protein [Microbacteriaceae bacterium]